MRLPNWFTTMFPQYAPAPAPTYEGEIVVEPPAPPARVITGPLISTVGWKSVGSGGLGNDANWVRQGNYIHYTGKGGDSLRSPPVDVDPGQLVKIAVSIASESNGATGNQLRTAKGSIGITAYRADGRDLGTTRIDLIANGTAVAELVMPPLTHHCIFILHGSNTTESGSYSDNPLFQGEELTMNFSDLERVI